MTGKLGYTLLRTSAITDLRITVTTNRPGSYDEEEICHANETLYIYPSSNSDKLETVEDLASIGAELVDFLEGDMSGKKIITDSYPGYYQAPTASTSSKKCVKRHPFAYSSLNTQNYYKDDSVSTGGGNLNPTSTTFTVANAINTSYEVFYDNVGGNYWQVNQEWLLGYYTFDVESDSDTLTVPTIDLFCTASTTVENSYFFKVSAYITRSNNPYVPNAGNNTVYMSHDIVMPMEQVTYLEMNPHTFLIGSLNHNYSYRLEIVMTYGESGVWSQSSPNSHYISWASPAIQATTTISS